MPDAITYRLSDSYFGSSVISYDLDDGTNYKSIDLSGRGIVEPDWAIDSAPQGLYSSLAGLSLRPRNMTLRLMWMATTEVNADARKDELGRIFKPFDPAWSFDLQTNPLGAWLRIVRGGGTTRQIECYPTGMTDMPMTVSEAIEASRINGRVSVNLVAPDPTFYDPTAETYSDTSMSGSGSGSFSADIDGMTWFAYPKFTVTGPFTTLRIHNGAFRSEFTLNSVGSGVTLIVDPSSSSVRDGKRIYNSSSGADELDQLDDPAEGFGTFFIPPSWMESGATTDTISYSYTGGTGASQLSMSYNKRYVNA